MIMFPHKNIYLQACTYYQYIVKSKGNSKDKLLPVVHSTILKHSQSVYIILLKKTWEYERAKPFAEIDTTEKEVTSR